jgi:hypothetical protein
MLIPVNSNQVNDYIKYFNVDINALRRMGKVNFVLETFWFWIQNKCPESRTNSTPAKIPGSI